MTPREAILAELSRLRDDGHGDSADRISEALRGLDASYPRDLDDLVQGIAAANDLLTQLMVGVRKVIESQAASAESARRAHLRLVAPADHDAPEKD